MEWKTIDILDEGLTFKIILQRPEKQNSINFTMLEEINQAMDLAEKSAACRIVFLESSDPDFFSSGMDFQEVALSSEKSKMKDWSELFVSTLKRFTTVPRLIVSKVTGKTIAGGMGFIGASDIVLASQEASFRLTESLWGLIPATIAPFLIRRAGFQNIYSMALTCKTVSPEEAKSMKIVDVLPIEMEEEEKRLAFRMRRIEPATITALKSFFKKIWVISSEIEEMAADEITKLVQQPEIQARIANFVDHHKMPWEG